VGSHVARYEDLGDVAGQKVGDLGHGGDLHAGAHDDDEIDLVPVDVLEAVEEVVGQGLAEEGDVRLHDARLGDVEGAVRLGVLVAGALLAGALTVGGALALLALLLGGDVVDAALALGGLHGAHGGEDVLAGDVELALAAGGGGPGAVALDQLVLADAGVGLDVVDVLGVVGEQLVLVLQQADELVGRGPLLEVGHDVAGQLVKDARVVVEVVDVEDLLGLVVAHLAQARVEARVLGAEVGDAQAGGDAGAGDDHDVAAALEQAGGVVEVAVGVEARALVELAVDGEAEQLVEALVGRVVEEARDTHVEGGAQLARRHLLAGDVLHDELRRAHGVQALPQLAGLVGGACLCGTGGGAQGGDVVEDLFKQ
jgi:hypothetical protein